TRSFEQRRHSVVSFVTSGLRVNPIGLVALLGQFLFDSPRSRPCRRILNRDDVIERVGTGAGPAFDEMQVLARSLEIGFGREIGDVDDQGFAFPMAPRISKPLTDIRRKMGLRGDGNRARKALSLAHIVQDSDRSGRLHDTTITSTELSSKIR